MNISRELAIQILRYCFENKDFVFPFLVVCKEYSDEDDDFVEIENGEWEIMAEDDKYKTFQLWSNLFYLKSLDDVVLNNIAKTFIFKIEF